MRWNRHIWGRPTLWHVQSGSTGVISQHLRCVCSEGTGGLFRWKEEKVGSACASTWAVAMEAIRLPVCHLTHKKTLSRSILAFSGISSKKKQHNRCYRSACAVLTLSSGVPCSSVISNVKKTAGNWLTNNLLSIVHRMRVRYFSGPNQLVVQFAKSIISASKSVKISSRILTLVLSPISWSMEV